MYYLGKLRGQGQNVRVENWNANQAQRGDHFFVLLGPVKCKANKVSKWIMSLFCSRPRAQRLSCVHNLFRAFAQKWAWAFGVSIIYPDDSPENRAKPTSRKLSGNKEKGTNNHNLSPWAVGAKRPLLLNYFGAAPVVLHVLSSLLPPWCQRCLVSTDGRIAQGPGR